MHALLLTARAPLIHSTMTAMPQIGALAVQRQVVTEPPAQTRTICPSVTLATSIRLRAPLRGEQALF
jgi:hypothetical protein